MGKVAIFVEDRISRDSAGRVRSGNRRLEDRQWEDLGPKGHDAVLCARLTAADDVDARHPVAGRVYGLPYYQGIGGANLAKLPLVLAKAIAAARRVDLVVAKCPGLVGSMGVLAAKLARKPVALHFVGDLEEGLLDSRSATKRRTVQSAATRLTNWAVRSADAVRYPTRGFLQGKYPAAHPSRQFWYTDAAVVAVDQVTAEPSFVPGRILAIGTQERMYKGHDLLIKALTTIREQVPHAHLVLVGKGIFRADLENLVRELGLTDAVEFVDFLYGWGEVSAMVRSAEVFAMPSLVEGLPRALLEAMSLGTACVGSDVAGIPELLPPYLVVRRGTVEPLADLLVRLLTDGGLRRKAAEDCLENSRDFTAEALQPNIDAWQQRLQQLIAG